MLILHYDDFDSHVILPSLALVSCFKTLEVFKSSLCKSAWSQKGRWKILLGVSHEVKVQVYNYLKEKWRTWKYVVCFPVFKVLLMVLKGPEMSLPITDTRRWHIWRRAVWSLSGSTAQGQNVSAQWLQVWTITVWMLKWTQLS